MGADSGPATLTFGAFDARKRTTGSSHIWGGQLVR